MMAFIHGGSGSGKSAFAEDLLLAQKQRAAARNAPLLYIATMSPEGEDARSRIAKHRAARARKGFETVELRTDLASAHIPEGSAVLLECLGNLLANELFSPGGAGKSGAAESARESILRGVDHLARRAARTIIVSNDVFADGVDYPPETRRYIDILAYLNRTVAARAALVVETVCGIPLRLKDEGGWSA